MLFSRKVVMRERDGNGTRSGERNGTGGYGTGFSNTTNLVDYAPAAAFVPRYNGWQTTGGWHDISPDAAGWSDGGYKYAICKKKVLLICVVLRNQLVFRQRRRRDDVNKRPL